MSSPKNKLEFISTADASQHASLREVLLSSMPGKGGLWVPKVIPQITPDFVEKHRNDTYAQLAESVISPYLADELGPDVLKRLCEDAFNFPVPLIHPQGYHGKPEGSISVLELLQGPSAAFKDFAVRLLVRVTAHVLGKDFPELTIIAATSGDTGGAVTEACANVPGVRAVVLYPRVGVSAVQESQIARKRRGVVAVSVDGTFDDCQALVKKALGDQSLSQRRPLLTVNSVRLVRFCFCVSFAFFVGQESASRDYCPFG